MTPAPNTHTAEVPADGGRSTRYVVGVSAAAALGGLLFGYDTAVIAGAIGPLQERFSLSPAMTGWAASSALLGCVLGVAVAGLASDRFGRRRALVASAVLFLVSTAGTALPQTLAAFVAFRVVGGVGVGIASMTSPLYIAEVAPAGLRGRLVSLNQLAIIGGMLVVYFVNYAIAAGSEPAWVVAEGWRWMFGSEAVPALLFLAALLAVPETPRWLAGQGRTEEARAVLARSTGSAERAERDLASIRAALAEEPVAFRQLFRPGLRRVLWIGVALAVLQQVTGINVFLYYAPEIFKALGAGGDAALLQTVVVGAVNLGFTVVAIFTVDRVGRRPLLMGGAAGMGVSLAALGAAAYAGAVSAWALVFVLGYIACFAVSMGPVVWVVLSEIFPTRVRGRALAVATLALWTANFVVSQTFPVLDQSPFLVERFGHALPFWIYAGFCALTVAFVWRFIPETKGRSLEEIEREWALAPHARGGDAVAVAPVPYADSTVA